MRLDVAHHLSMFNIKSTPALSATPSRTSPARACLRAPTPDPFAFNLYFLLVRVLLRFVIYVPTERNEKLINEIVSGFPFLISRREIVPFARFKISGQLFHPLESCLEIL
jgi:hypothetical protein